MRGLALLQGLPEPGILLFQPLWLVQQALKLFFLSLECSWEQKKTGVLVRVGTMPSTPILFYLSGQGLVLLEERLLTVCSTLDLSPSAALDSQRLPLLLHP